VSRVTSSAVIVNWAQSEQSARVMPGRAALLWSLLFATAVAAETRPGYERLSREQLVSALAAAPVGAPFTAKDLSDQDLSGLDFRGANLSASVFNGSQLSGAKLDSCNLTVSFFEGAKLPKASLAGAMMFSVQMAGAVLTEANLSGARLIGDLRKADVSGANLTKMNGAADMRNQSMGLMRTNLVNATARGTDFSDSDFSRADFSFTDFTGAKFLRTKLVRVEMSGATLTHADLSGADLRDAVLIDADLSNANLTNADLTGAELRGVRGLDSAIRTGTRGLP
jgi:uncharacterized protein YjbI with pentapeptide repeats